jgi:hypothetical protein
VKSISGEHITPILCFVPGLKSNHDVMDAIAEISEGKTIKISDFGNISSIIDALTDLTSGGS